MKVLTAVIFPVAMILALMPKPWKPADALPSVGHLIQQGHHCTSVSVAVNRWLSVAHCQDIKAFGDGTAVEDVKIDAVKDLRLTTGPVAEPIPMAHDEPQLGETVWLFGWTDVYGALLNWVAPKPIMFTGHIAVLDVNVNFADVKIEHANLILDGGGPGMSGGPVLNARGELVGIVQALSEHPSIVMMSPTVKTIRQFLGLK